MAGALAVNAYAAVALYDQYLKLEFEHYAVRRASLNFHSDGLNRVQ